VFSDIIEIFRIAFEFLEVLGVIFSSSAKVTPFRGGFVQCFGAGNTRTAAEIHGLRIPQITLRSSGVKKMMPLRGFVHWNNRPYVVVTSLPARTPPACETSTLCVHFYQALQS